MSNFEVPSPILSSPFEEPKEHWWILEGQPVERRPGRRPALYFYRDPKRETDERGGLAIEMEPVNRIRERLQAWRESGYAGVTRTTLELLQHWRRERRERRLFFAQIEAAETILFLVEARADFRQGLEIPRDEPSDDRKAEGFAGFLRYACKMATGSGKTTVMGMLAAWSILNKVNDRSDGRFSDVVLIPYFNGNAPPPRGRGTVVENRLGALAQPFQQRLAGARTHFIAQQDADFVELLPSAIQRKQRTDFDEAAGNVERPRDLGPIVKVLVFLGRTRLGPLVVVVDAPPEGDFSRFLAR